MKTQGKEAEKKRLADIAKHFSMREGFEVRLEKYRFAIIREHIRNDRILEVGCAEGVMTENLAKHFKHITAIDGSQKLIADAKKLRLRNADFICTLFEEFKPREKFNSIVLVNILEHVQHPVRLLSMSRRWLAKKGTIFIICPNAQSLHRRIGVMAGMLKHLHELNERDRRIGHRRVYDAKSLKKDIRAAKLKVKSMGGIFLKPLSNSQLDGLGLDEKILDAMFRIGKDFPPELLAELYVQCTA
ncbi:MAG: class I SAM-dependent methyltransferase [Parcubacteria group bacterium]|nr:class I SAM-dependent methyltransferase [Parcubacteria group bacterium]